MKADIFSYGVVLWELCSLQKPFAGMTAHQHARKVSHQIKVDMVYRSGRTSVAGAVLRHVNQRRGGTND